MAKGVIKECNICQRSFRGDSALQRHVSNAHRKSPGNVRLLSSTVSTVMEINETNAAETSRRSDGNPVSVRNDDVGINSTNREGETPEFNETNFASSHETVDRPSSGTDDVTQNYQKEQMASSKPKFSKKCQICHRLFRDWYGLNLHIYANHKNELNGLGKECKICHKFLRDSHGLNRHIKAVHKKESNGTKKECKICHTVFHDMYTLRRHVLIDHRETAAKECPFCDKAFVDMEHLRLHIRRCHKDLYYKKTPTSEKECPICHKILIGITDIRRHICRAHKPESLKENTDTNEPNAASNDEHSETDEMGTGNSLKKQMISSKQTMNFGPECEICHKPFRYFYYLNQHYNSVHKKKSDGTTKECHICHKVLQDTYTLRRHILVNHRDTTKECPFCDKNFLNTSELNQHTRRLHQGLYKKKSPNISQVNETNAVSSTTTDDRSVSETVNVKNKNSSKRGGEALQVIETNSVSVPENVVRSASGTNKRKNENSTKQKTTSLNPNSDKTCKICRRVFCNPFGLKRHINSVHKKEPDGTRKECDICHNVFQDTYTLRQHVLDDHREIAAKECLFCEKTYINMSCLRRHIRDQHNDQNFDKSSACKKKCSLCHKTFRNATYFNLHDQLVHKRATTIEKSDGNQRSSTSKTCNTLELIETNAVSSTANDDRSVSEPVDVGNINSSNRGGEALQLIETNVVSVPVTVETSTSTKNKTKNENSAKQKTTYLNTKSDKECKICHRLFYNQSVLRRHINSVHKKKPDGTTKECDICHKVFQDAYTLWRHVLDDHREKSGMECKICHRRFLNSCKLNRHINAIHNKDGTTKECDVCHKVFQDAYSLRRHVLVDHTETAAKECPSCHKLFLKPVYLRRHIRSFHKDFYHKKSSTKECPICQKTFKYPFQVRHHIRRIHKLEQSKDILGNYRFFMSTGSTVVEANELNTLRSSVTNGRSTDDVINENFPKDRMASSKPIISTRKECNICQNSFFDKYTLRRHVLLKHWKNATRKCPYCDKRYLNTCSLYLHIRSLHKDLCKKKTPTKECHICHKVFKIPRYVRRHISRVHVRQRLKKNSGNPRLSRDNVSTVMELNATNTMRSTATDGKPVSDENDDVENEIFYRNWLKRSVFKNVSFTCDCGKTHYSEKEYLLHLFMFHPEIYEAKKAELFPSTYS